MQDASGLAETDKLIIKRKCVSSKIGTEQNIHDDASLEIWISHQE